MAPAQVPGAARSSGSGRRARGLGRLDDRVAALLLEGTVGAGSARLVPVPGAPALRLPVEPERNQRRGSEQEHVHDLGQRRLSLPGHRLERRRQRLADERAAHGRVTAAARLLLASSPIREHVNFVVVAKTSLPRLLTFAEERGWRRLRLLSSGGNTYNRAYYAATAE